MKVLQQQNKLGLSWAKLSSRLVRERERFITSNFSIITIITVDDKKSTEEEAFFPALANFLFTHYGVGRGSQEKL